MTPTIEEFERILGWPLKDNLPFLNLGEELIPEKLAEALYMPINEVLLLLKNNGILKSKLQEKATDLSTKKEDQDSFNAILALLIFGVVLFPSNDDNYIASYAINVFLAKNPVPTLVADVLYHHHVRYGKKKGIVLCCTPLLFKWLQSHMPQRGPWVTTLEDMPWPQKLDALTPEAVNWYTPSIGKSKVIMSCGDFPNVPLIGSQGCINYNPILALRQLGYPIEAKPESEQLDPFILENFGKENIILLEKIKNAWILIHKKDGELKKRQTSSGGSYYQWITERAREIKLPHVRTVPFAHPDPLIVQTLEKENEELKRVLKEKDEEIATLQAKSTRHFLEAEKLATDLKESNEELKGRREQNEKDEARIIRYKEEVESSTVCIKDLHRRLKEAQKARGQAYLDEERAVKRREASSKIFEDQIEKLENILRNERALKEEAMISLKIEFGNSASLNEELTNSKEDFDNLFKKCHEWIKDIERLNQLLKEKDEIISIQENQNNLYYGRYANLVDVCNRLVVDVPWRLRSAIENLETNPVPLAVRDFLFLCRDVVERFQAATRDLKPRRGRHF